MAECFRSLMNEFLYFLHFLRKYLNLPVEEYFHLYNENINTCALTCFTAVERVKLNGACKITHNS